jgi:hypothetical protein
MNQKVAPLPKNTQKPPKKKLIFKILSFFFATLLLIIIIVGLFYGNQIRSLLTFTQVGDENLYTMTYYGGYKFGDYLKKGITPAQIYTLNNQTKPQWACSVFSARNEKGTPLLGRNFDWGGHTALLLFTDPPDGYRSVSLVPLGDLVYPPSFFKPPYFIHRIFPILNAPRDPSDGMNECGLAIGLMGIPNSEGSHDPQKITITTIDAIRLVLDYAKDVEEAITLLKKYNIIFQKPGLHYLIVDATGNSAVIEFLNGKMEVIRSSEPWQVATNIQLTGTKDVASLCYRYRTAEKTLQKTGGVISEADAMKLLKFEICQANTLWSVVYNLSTGDIQVSMGFTGDLRRISQVKKFKLEMKR